MSTPWLSPWHASATVRHSGADVLAAAAAAHSQPQAGHEAFIDSIHSHPNPRRAMASLSLFGETGTLGTLLRCCSLLPAWPPAGSPDRLYHQTASIGSATAPSSAAPAATAAAAAATEAAPSSSSRAVPGAGSDNRAASASSLLQSVPVERFQRAITPQLCEALRTNGYAGGWPCRWQNHQASLGDLPSSHLPLSHLTQTPSLAPAAVVDGVFGEEAAAVLREELRGLRHTPAMHKVGARSAASGPMHACLRAGDARLWHDPCSPHPCRTTLTWSRAVPPGCWRRSTCGRRS